MLFRSFAAPAAVAAACLCLPAVSAAQTYTITPKFPDNFALRNSITSDDTKVNAGQVEKNHTAFTISATVNRQDNGYKAVYRIEDVDMQTWGADGKPQVTAEEVASVTTLFRALGVAKVTLDASLVPVTVDNIDEIKVSVNSLAAASTEDNDLNDRVLAAMVKDLTPETAANFLKVQNKWSRLFNVPMTLNVPLQMPPHEVEIMGGTFRTTARATLIGWEDGKIARVRYVTAPSDADLMAFLRPVMLGLMAGDTRVQSKESQAMVQAVLDNMTASMTETCDLEISLANFVDTTSTCDNKIEVVVDLKAVVPPDVAAANPELAVPTALFTQTTHTVTETKLIP